MQALYFCRITPIHIGRIIAIDYGLKRTGLAVSDPDQIIATPLEVVPTEKLISFLEEYFKNEIVDILVIGEPKNLKGKDTHTSQKVRELYNRLGKHFSGKKIFLVDERFTSKLALKAMIDGGLKKKERTKKGNIDKISATIILQSFLEQKFR
jgi:putative Holliday junction resolvase